MADRQVILVVAGWCCCDHWEHWSKWSDEDFVIAKASLRDQMYRLRSHPSMVMWLNGSDNPPPPDVEETYLQVERICSGPIRSSLRRPRNRRRSRARAAERCRAPTNTWRHPYWSTDPHRRCRNKRATKADAAAPHGFNTETSLGPAVPPIESVSPDDSQRPSLAESTTSGTIIGGGAFRNLHVFVDAQNARYGAANSAEDFTYKSQLMTIRRRARHVRSVQPQQVHLDGRDPVDC